MPDAENELRHMTNSTKDSTKEKRETLERFLGDEHALVHVAPRGEGVVLPEHLTKNPTVTLKLSRYFRGKMEVHPYVVHAELLFGEEYFTCKVPFTSIWGMTSIRGQFLMWPESTPAEVLAGLEKQSEARRTEALAVDPVPAAAESAPSEARPVSKRPHLRRVK